MVFQESEILEFKSIIVDNIKKEIIAFANCKGGKLYIGIRDDGTVVGVDDPDEAALQVSNMIRQSVHIILQRKVCARKGFMSVRDIRLYLLPIRQSAA